MHANQQTLATAFSHLRTLYEDSLRSVDAKIDNAIAGPEVRDRFVENFGLKYNLHLPPKNIHELKVLDGRLKTDMVFRKDAVSVKRTIYRHENEICYN